MDVTDLTQVLGESWPKLLENIGDAVIVMDRERCLQFANHRARQILGFEEGELVGGRCRHTTQGVDCETACPLTVALNMGRDIVRDFETTYRARDGRLVPLSVTIIPLMDEANEFNGAVEILRPIQADGSFYLVGRSKEAVRLRQKIADLAGENRDVVLVGEHPACLDVARSLHRARGLDPALFRQWDADEEVELGWPPGTVCGFGTGAIQHLPEVATDGWRRVYCLGPHDGNGIQMPDDAEVVRLPEVGKLVGDLPEMMIAWVHQVDPDLEVSASALEHLVCKAQEQGLSRVAEIIPPAVAVAGKHLDVTHFPGPEPDVELIDELLRADDPMAELEHRMLTEVLERSRWKMQDAADRLGMSRVTLWRKLKEHNIARP